MMATTTIVAVPAELVISLPSIVSSLAKTIETVAPLTAPLFVESLTIKLNMVAVKKIYC